MLEFLTPNRSVKLGYPIPWYRIGYEEPEWELNDEWKELQEELYIWKYTGRDNPDQNHPLRRILRDEWWAGRITTRGRGQEPYVTIFETLGGLDSDQRKELDVQLYRRRRFIWRVNLAN